MQKGIDILLEYMMQLVHLRQRAIMQLTIVFHFSSIFLCPQPFPYVNEWTATAWHLTKVEDYNYNVIFELNYERDYFTAQIYNTP